MIVVFAALVCAALAQTSCSGSVGTMVVAGTSQAVELCSVSQNCPAVSTCSSSGQVGSVSTCTFSGGSITFTCEASSATSPSWSRSSFCPTPQTCTSTFGWVVSYPANSTQLATGGADLQPCSGSCPPISCCFSGTYNEGGVVQCSGTPDTAPVWACMKAQEDVKWRSLCNAYCGSGIGSIAGLGNCNVNNNCPAAGCCDIAAQAGSITSCRTGTGATLTFNCTSPGNNPVFTPVPVVASCPSRVAAVGTPYNSRIGASGGSGVYSSYVISGATPGFWGGVSGSNLTGSPALNGGNPWVYTVTVTDSVGASGAVVCNISVTSAPTLSCVGSPGSAEVSLAFASAPFVTAAGGTGSGYVYTLSGSTPTNTNPFVIASGTGNLAINTPTQNGTFQITVSVRDSSGGVATATCPFTIIPGPVPTCPASGGSPLTQGFEGIPLPSATSTFSGGSGLGTFSIIGGTGMQYTMSNVPGTSATFSGTYTNPSMSSPQTYNYQVKVVDAKGGSGTVSCSITVYPRATVACPGVANVAYIRSGTSYSGTATLGGGTGTYTVVFNSTRTNTFGSLLTVSNTGVVSSTGPLSAQTISYLLYVTSGGAQSGISLTCTLNVLAPPTIACPAGGFAAGENGAVYPANQAVTFTATGQTITATSLPSGLVLNTTSGAVTGTPTVNGTFNTVFTVTDGASQTANITCPIVIAPGPTASCVQPAFATSNLAYSGSFSVSGGTGPYSWTSNPLSGFTLTAATGAVTSANVGGAGNKVFSNVVVKDALGASSPPISCTIVVTNAPSFSCPSGVATTNVLYQATLTMSGGAAPATWGVASVTPASGFPLSISGSTLQGTPTATGTYSVNITLTDNNNRAFSKVCTITVSNPPSIGPCPTFSVCSGASFNSAGVPVIDPGAGGGSFSISPTLTGLTLNTTTGALTGSYTGTNGFNQSFTFTFTDANNQKAQLTCWFIVSALKFSPTTCPVNSGASLLSANLNQPFVRQIGVTGGVGTLTWGLTTSPNVGWLSVNSSGFLVGTPTATDPCGPGTTAPCSFTYTVTVTDGKCSLSLPCTLWVFDIGALSCASTTPQTVNVGVQTITFGPPANSTGPFNYTVVSVTPSAPAISVTNGPSTLKYKANFTTAGTYTFCINITDGLGRALPQACCQITVVNLLSFTCPPNGVTCQTYTFQMTANGGVPPYTWQFTQVSIVPLKINTTGYISLRAGQVLTPRSDLYTIRVTDSRGGSNLLDQNCTVVFTGPTVTCPPANTRVVRGVPFSAQLGSINCTSCVFSTVPVTNLTVSSSGAISGTFSGTAANVTFSGNATSVTDGCTTFSCLINVVAPPTLSCPTGVQAQFIDQGRGWTALIGGSKISDVGVTTNYTWTLKTPSVTQASNNMTLNGTETSALALGNLTYTITLADTAGSSLSVTCWVVVSAPFALSCGTLGNGSLTVPYSGVLSGSGTPSLVFANTTALPGGLLLNTATGSVTGTPQQSGTFSLGFRLTDNLGVTTTVTCPIRIATAPALSCNTSAQYAIVGQAYSKSVLVCTTCVSFANTSALPGNLVFSGNTASAVSVAGTPGLTVVGFTGTDSSGAVGIINCPIQIVSSFTLGCPSPITVDIGQPFQTSSPTLTPSNTYASPLTFRFSTLPTGSAGSTGQGFVVSTTGLSPQATGPFNYVVNVTDAALQFAQSPTCTITINPALVFSCPANITVGSGVAFSQPLTASGGSGTGTYTFSVTSAPPAGNWPTFSVTGSTLNGTPNPSYSGVTSYKLSVTDTTGGVVTTLNCFVTVNAPLSVSCPLQSGFTVGVPYSQKAIGSGGKGSSFYQFSMQSGPSQLTIDPDGTVRTITTFSGNTTGSYVVSLFDTVTTVTKTCPFTVYNPPSLACPVFTNAEVSLTSSSAFTVTGGSQAGWTFATTALPPTLTLNATSGLLSGTFTSAGTFNFSGNVTDNAGGFAASVPCSVNIVSTPQITCPPATASVTIPYTSVVTVSGGIGTITFTIPGSSLPAGLQVSNGNQISGTPAIVGTYNFQVNVTDSLGVKSFRTCTIQVGSPGCLSQNENTTLSNSSSVCTSCATCKRLANPCFNKQCQLNVVLILDQSASISFSNAVADVRAGVNAFISGMQSIVNVGGTVNMGVITFDTNASLTFPMTSFTPTFQNQLITYVNTQYLTSGGATNWAQALVLAGRDWGVTVDIFVFFTDGQPEVAFGPWTCADGCYDETTGAGKIFFSDICAGSAACPNNTAGLTFNSQTGFQKANLWAACTAADALKQSGAKIFLVGVGDVPRNEDEIQVITGLTRWDGSSTSFFRSDYVINSNYSLLGTLFRQVGEGLCPCLSSYPACDTVGQSCNARLFSARVQVTTTSTVTGTVFPKTSVIAAYLYYNFLGGASARVSYDFFAASETVSTVTPTVGTRTDILNPCKLQRLVTCGTGCFNIQEKQNLPRFFLEASDTPGTFGSRLYSNSTIPGCTGFTKVYPYPTFPFNYGTVSPEAIRFIWTLNSDGITPCAAEAYDGTMYEFYQNPTTRGVVGMGNPPISFTTGQPVSFVPNGTCTVPNCTNPVEMVFVIDEQMGTAGAADFRNIQTFILTLINSANPASTFGWIWSQSGLDQPPAPNLLPQQAGVPGGDLASYLVAGHPLPRGGTTDFAGLVSQAANTFFPGATSPSQYPRQIVTIVAGPDSGASGTSFASMQALLASKNIEYWSIGVNAGSGNVTLLSLLASTNQYAHYQSFTVSSDLVTGTTAADLSLRLCPAGSLCGAGCKGFCRCAGAGSCECPQCAQDNCTLTRTCTNPQAGCFGSAKTCDDKDACTTDTCDLIKGCQFTLSVFCDDNNACSADKCVNGACQYTFKTCTGADPCYQNNLCDSVSGNCLTTVPVDPSSYNASDNACFFHTCPIGAGGPVLNITSCNDSNECTIDACINATGCSYTNRTCNDNNLCTQDLCNSTLTGGCYFPSNSSNCVVSDRCSIGLCNATSGCYTVSNATNCIGTDACMVYSCDSSLGCQAVPRVCSDGDFCKNWTCNSLTGCSYTNITCDDGNQCTTDRCLSDPSTSSFVCSNVFNPAICATCSFSPCTDPVTACQQAICVDQLTTVTCADPRVPDPAACLDGITNANPARYCFVVDTSARCNDGNNCTNDRCDNTLGCQNTPVVCPTSNCTLTSCDVVTGCQSTPKACNDNLACTVDTCDNTVAGGCVYTPVNCNDNNSCTTEQCVESVGGCVFTNVTCDDHDVCTTDSCAPLTGCSYSPRRVCDDGSLCTTDRCDAVLGCVYTPIAPCNDNLNCTRDFCDPLGGCQFIPKTCTANTNCTTYACSESQGGVCVSSAVPCDDGNACTTDTCVESAGGCVHTNISCTSPSLCEIWTCVPSLGRCNKTGDVVCDDKSSCTTDTCISTTGCAYRNISCGAGPTACTFATGCIGDIVGQPVCVFQNISSLIDLCGNCLGDNTACFFSSIIGVGAVAGITAGAVAGIVVAAVIAALLAFWLSKKGYDYYKAQSDLSASGLTNNPYYARNEMAGELPSVAP